MTRKKVHLLLRWLGVTLLGGVFLTFCFRDDLRDFMVDDTLYAAEIRAAATKYGLDPQLVRAVVFRESRFDPFARGRAGELGLMQVLPAGAVADYARTRKISPPPETALFDPATNLEIGCFYLAAGMRKYKEYTHGTELALARYNAGESRSERWKPTRTDGTVTDRITIESTRKYVEKIMTRYGEYRREKK